jgi:hypothetical protein
MECREPRTQRCCSNRSEEKKDFVKAEKRIPQELKKMFIRFKMLLKFEICWNTFDVC